MPNILDDSGFRRVAHARWWCCRGMAGIRGPSGGAPNVLRLPIRPHCVQGLMLLERTDAAAEKGGSGSDPRSGRWRQRCLANWADGRPINYANDLDIAADGRIFFT